MYVHVLRVILNIINVICVLILEWVIKHLWQDLFMVVMDWIKWGKHVVCIKYDTKEVRIIYIYIQMCSIFGVC